MAKVKRLLTLIAVAAMVPGCDVTQKAETNRVTETNTASHEQAIRDINVRWLALVEAKDAAGVASLYAENGSLMAPNMPVARGRSEIQRVWQSMMVMPGFDLRFQTEELVVSTSGDMALDRGTYSFAATPPSGPFQDKGKAVVVWRNVGGQWQVAADIFNSDQPAQ